MNTQEKQPVQPMAAPQITTAQDKFTYGFGCFYELTKWLIVLVILLSMVHFFIASISIVDGVSMEPSLHSGEMMVVNRWQYLFGEPKRGDIVTLKFPGDPEHKKYVKRLIGLPGNEVKIENGTVYINRIKLNEKYLASDTYTTPDLTRVLGNDEYFVLGDNRDNSNDSRIWGPANKRYLIGSGLFILWPVKNFGEIKNPVY
jgi:signal peptidase I